MEMCSKFFPKLVYLAIISAFFSFTASPLFAMGGKPEKTELSAARNIPESHITLKELAEIYWPDSNSTQVQQEETLKNLLGKRVKWQITVAQIQRDGKGYLIQGQSDRDMLGTFSYVTPENDVENDAIMKAQMGSKLEISGIVSDMRMRHMVLKPAQIVMR